MILTVLHLIWDLGKTTYSLQQGGNIIGYFCKWKQNQDLGNRLRSSVVANSWKWCSSASQVLSETPEKYFTCLQQYEKILVAWDFSGKMFACCSSFSLMKWMSISTCLVVSCCRGLWAILILVFLSLHNLKGSSMLNSNSLNFIYPQRS